MIMLFFSLMFFDEYLIFFIYFLIFFLPSQSLYYWIFLSAKNGKLIFLSVTKAWCSYGEFVFKQFLLIIQFCLYICHVKEMWGLNVDSSTPDLRISSLRISSKLGSKSGFTGYFLCDITNVWEHFQALISVKLLKCYLPQRVVMQIEIQTGGRIAKTRHLLDFQNKFEHQCFNVNSTG